MECLNLTTKILVYKYEESSDVIKNLINIAKQASEKAYAPYSNFRVGAAILLSNNTIVTGNNQENAAYPSGLCAERVAIFHANAEYPEVAVEAIAIAACDNKGKFTVNPCSPCGGCRQVLLESENRYGKAIRIILYGEKMIYELSSAKDLLPVGFGKDSFFD